jgi:hypothetical protein
MTMVVATPAVNVLGSTFSAESEIILEKRLPKQFLLIAQRVKCT